ncbi:MAG: molybdate transport system substrate-binding protein [Pseudonocardiales bacterium]|jgi:molybdate transport system substrate-binding protein|nr:molybdate transport system substrate-binding protein [Pseudonocardiales bacterium]
MHGRTAITSAALAAAVTLLAACGSSNKTSTQAGDAAASGSALSGTVTVLAAASLQDTFTTLGKQFETAHRGVTVKLNFGASSALALQINQGAPADVFASASTKNMTQVSDAGGAAAPTNFAKNVMQIAVPPSNPGKVSALADLARPGVKLALCQPQVPCGATAAKVFSNAKLNVRPVTLEADVKSTLTKVELNEVDAGLVYVTDVRAAGSKVKGIDIPAELNASTEYPIATLTRARDGAAARAFTAYVLSTAGQAVLAAAGFEKP